MAKKEYPMCPDDAIDCFGACYATKNDCKCKILYEGIEDCPFFKPKYQYEKERKEYESRASEVHYRKYYAK